MRKARFRGMPKSVFITAFSPYLPGRTLPVVTAVLATLSAVYYELAFWFTSPYGYHQRIQYQFT
ncbi:hypothetical protein DZS_21500 [Dickeya ananatis]